MFNSERNSLNKQVFVPVTDELIFDTPEMIEGPLVPYASGMACHGWLSIELNPDDSTALASSKATISKPSGDRKGKAYELLHKVGLKPLHQPAHRKHQAPGSEQSSAMASRKAFKPVFSS